MAGFSETALDKRLTELNGSAQSIQTVSLWLIHHRKHHAAIVKAWQSKLFQAPDSTRKLIYVYLANDVIQTSRKKGTEYGTEFQKVLPSVFKHLSAYGSDEKLSKSLMKVINVWEERHVYTSAFIQELRNALGGSSSPGTPPQPQEPPAKKHREHREKRRSESEVVERADGSREIHVTLSPRAPPSDPPETDELVKALQELENAASGDAAVRERISKLPPEISEVKRVADIQDKGAAHNFVAQVNEAMALLSDYNKRLSDEMEERRNVSRMLKDYLSSQEELLSQAQQRLEEYRDKLQKIYQVRRELENHLRSLPDLTRLPSMQNPLPSAGDLFGR